MSLRAEERARLSLGVSEQAIYEMAARALAAREICGELVLDVGCGAGRLRPFVSERFARYVGVDVLCYEEFPADAEFIRADLDTGRADLPDACADAVLSVETIEHLENPRAFMRELVRLAKPGGWVFVTTPNIASLLSLITLAGKERFASFQDCDYPAHISPVLAADLRRMAGECGLRDTVIEYSLSGRVIFTESRYPRSLARLAPRWFSDNLLLAGRKA
jgi:2-polyprenyl-3-methyl-5-hydroxy-6-metoxy-1,4-benzoquinol methylase